MTKITYLKGDVTHPQGSGKIVIPHVCNDKGAWGSGVVLAISKRWDEPEMAYRAMKTRRLGDVEFIEVSDDIIVANMIGQHDIWPDSNGNPPIRYDAVELALTKVNLFCQAINASIHAPKFGCGLAGGKWDEIEKIIQKVVKVPVYVYEF